MRSRSGLALLAICALGFAGACSSPTDVTPNPKEDDERDDPGNGDGGTEAFMITLSERPILA